MSKQKNPNKKAVDQKQLPHLPRGVPMLQLFQQKTFGDAYQDYVSMIEQNHEEKRAYTIKAKLKTALRRFTLPGYGWTFVKDEAIWLSFLQSLSLQDLARAVEVQEQVFTQLGAEVSDDSRRSYRSSLKQFVEYIQTQPYYQIALGVQDEQVASRMHAHKKRQEHTHRLKPKEIPPQITAELEQITHYLLHLRSQTPYRKNLVPSSVKRDRREMLDLVSWLHRFKGEPLETLSFERLVPKTAISDEAAAEQVAQRLHEYVEWLQSYLGLSKGGLAFSVRCCMYIAEFWEYEQSTRV